jgi:hypothetical protein
MPCAIKAPSTIISLFTFTAAVLINAVTMVWPSAACAEVINESDFCAFEQNLFDLKQKTIAKATAELSNGANPLKQEALKQSLQDLSSQLRNARIAYFGGRGTHFERTYTNDPRIKATADIVEGQKEFSSFEGTVVKFGIDNVNLRNILTLALALKCPASSQRTIIFRTFVTDADLHVYYPNLGDKFDILTPSTELSLRRAQLTTLNVGDSVSMSGVLQLFLYATKDGPGLSFLARAPFGSYQLPPVSPEAGNTPELPVGGDPVSSYRAMTPGTPNDVVYNVELTDIQKHE